MSNIVVYGMGKTGQNLENLLKNGNQLYIYDDNPTLSKVTLNQIPFEAIDLLIVSPAVKPNSVLVEECQKHGIEVVSELQYCFSNCPSKKCISVTGTNGKTTTTELIYHILKAHEKPSWLLGNGGVPFCQHLQQIKPNDIVVHESSSFQLNFANNFPPYISILTNLHQEHLDYHVTYFNYIEAKCKNFINQTKDQFSIFNADDFECLALSRLATSKKLFYSLFDSSANCYFDGFEVIFNTDGQIEQCKSQYFNAQLPQNKSNILAAILATAILGISPTSALKSLENFCYLAHRMTLADSFNNINFIDDSKSTNIHSAIAALNCIQQDTVLILGGSDKGLTFDDIFSRLENVSLLVLIGQTAGQIFATAKKFNFKNVIICSNMKEAVFASYTHLHRRNGGTVLLSPACASFDMFNSYAHRGQVFCQCVKQLRADYAN